MNIKTLLVATAVAALPMMASAAVVPVISDDPMGATPTVIGSGENFAATFFVFSPDGGAGDFEHTFQLETDGSGSANVTIDLLNAGQFTDLVAQWLNADTLVEIAAATLTTGIQTTLATTFVDPNSLNQVLKISWTDSVKGVGFDGSVQISTVPVPAGLLLMGTALAGLGLTRRKA
jgi:hypothetical protein